MTRLWLERSFSATHQILIAGTLEPVHGHDFRVAITVEAREPFDAILLDPPLGAVLDPLGGTHLEAVERSQGGYPSAERIARHLYQALGVELVRSGLPARLSSVTVHESPGCSATWREGDLPA